MVLILHSKALERHEAQCLHVLILLSRPLVLIHASGAAFSWGTLFTKLAIVCRLLTHLQLGWNSSYPWSSPWPRFRNKKRFNEALEGIPVWTTARQPLLRGA